MFRAIRSFFFALFKGTYRVLAATPLRRIPGMLSLSNLFFRLTWSRGNIIEVQGNKMYVDVHDPHPNMRKTFQAYGMNLVHEEETTALFRKYAKAGDVVLDLGANIGYFSMLAARLVGPTGKVFSFEPEPTNFKYLSKNIEINGFSNVLASQMAVADKPGKTRLYVCAYDSGHHTINQEAGIEAYRRGRGGETAAIDIDTVSIDEFLKGKSDRVDIIKMDVEGAEALALAGMRETLQRNRSVRVFLEYFPLLMKKMQSSPEAYAESLLKDFGFAMYVIGHDYSMEGVQGDLVRIERVDQLTALIKAEDDHVNLYLTRDPL